MYEVYNRKTGVVVSKNCKSRRTASNARDRHDNKYGGYAHGVRLVTNK